MNSIVEIILGGGATAGAAGAVWAFLRSDSGRTLLAKIRKSVVSEATALREAIENLAQVVETQGASIEWLRQELTATRQELEEARSALNDKENRLAKENDKLRDRVAELEAQVKALEAALSKRTRAPRKVSTIGRKK